MPYPEAYRKNNTRGKCIRGGKRSFRIHQRSTTIKLESPFWQALEDIAEAQMISLADLIAKIDDRCRAVTEGAADKPNLASCLRVFCLMSPAERSVALVNELSPGH